MPTQTYSGKSIFQGLIENTWLGKKLYGNTTYTDGYGAQRSNASFKDSANGKLISRMGNTAKDAAKITVAGLSFANPITASSYMSPLITGSQAYFSTVGLKDAWDRLNKKDKTAEDGVNIGLDVLGTIPAVKALSNSIKNFNIFNPYTQKSLSGFSENKYYNFETKQWNTDLMNSDLKSGKQQAIEFLTSDVRNNTFARNNKIFKSKTGYNLPRNDSKISSPVQVKFDSTLKDNIGGDYNSTTDELRINSRSTSGYDRTLFHELLHRNGYGEAEDLYKYPEFSKENRSLAQDFYDNLTKKVMGNSDYTYYLWNRGEMPVNSLELGIKNGIKPGTKYPGKVKAEEIFEMLEKDPDKGFVMQTMRWKENPKYVWRAITGTLFGVNIPIILSNDKSKQYQQINFLKNK